MVVTAHQPTFLPGLSVTSKIAWADRVIWLDRVQYSHGGWTNRNRLPDGTWLTVPVEHSSRALPIADVRIADHGNWRRRLALTLEQRVPGSELLQAELQTPYRRLVALNLALLRILFHELGIHTPWHLQSHLDSGEAPVAVSDQPAELQPISERLAAMTAELGGHAYLSGPSGRRYLDETPFRERGLQVIYWHHTGPNPSSVTLLREPVPA